MSNVGEVKALLFDVFGTVVDWRTSIIRELEAWGSAKGISADWTAFTDDWRRLYQPSMEEVRSGRRPWTILDVLHRESLETLLARHGIAGLSAALHAKGLVAARIGVVHEGSGVTLQGAGGTAVMPAFARDELARYLERRPNPSSPSPSGAGL